MIGLKIFDGDRHSGERTVRQLSLQTQARFRTLDISREDSNKYPEIGRGTQ
jgi:hypothetical protein